jgi:predicted permease
VLKYSYLSPLIYICYAFSLCYFVLFYILCVFYLFAGLWKKMRYFWKSGLKEQKEEKLESEEAIERRRRVIDRTSD